jgi:hypothetical protein
VHSRPYLVSVLLPITCWRVHLVWPPTTPFPPSRRSTLVWHRPHRPTERHYQRPPFGHLCSTCLHNTKERSARRSGRSWLFGPPFGMPSQSNHSTRLAPPQQQCTPDYALSSSRQYFSASITSSCPIYAPSCWSRVRSTHRSYSPAHYTPRPPRNWCISSALTGSLK